MLQVDTCAIVLGLIAEEPNRTAGFLGSGITGVSVGVSGEQGCLHPLVPALGRLQTLRSAPRLRQDLNECCLPACLAL